ETCEAENGKSQQNGKKGRGRPSKLTIRRKGLSKDDQEARTRSSSASEELTTDVDNQPLSVWYQGLQQKAVLKSKHFCPIKRGAIMCRSGGLGENGSFLDEFG
ncbi:hypothetical protein Tco_1572770, partial [Tanacetum coccineum]